MGDLGRRHTDDDIAYLINGAAPVLLTGDASRLAWAFKTGVAPRGRNKAGTARGYVSLEQLRSFARAYRFKMSLPGLPRVAWLLGRGESRFEAAG